MPSEQVGLSEVELYLRTATILDVAHFAQHGAHRSYRLILEGGVGVLAKPSDTIPQGEIVPRREAAAWALARDLDWTDLVAATVTRFIDSPDSGDQVLASVQVLWPDFTPDADPNLFSDEDIWRAGVFDCLLGQDDRNGHNWLAVPGSSPTPGLKLVDHGFGFPDTVTPPNSTFYELRKGQQIPDQVLEAVGLITGGSFRRMRDYLPDTTVSGVIARGRALEDASVLEIKPP
jgi:hypothetical protein